ncbi:MAG: hypothetical protein ACKOH7_05025, partial [Solirubrobacterales bacterium]
LIGALSGGRMTAQGPVAPILRVVPLANLVAPKFQEFDGSGAAPAGEEDKAAEAGDAPEEEAPEEEAADGEPTDDEAEPAPEGDQS